MYSSPTTVVGSIARGEADSYASAFQGANVYNGASLLFNNFFLGITARTFFVLTGHGVPGGSLIDAATLTLVPDATRTAAAAGTVAAMPLDGTWDVPSFTGWRSPLWGTFKAHIRDTGAATIINTVPGAVTSFWGLAQETVVLRRQRLAVLFTPTVTATLGDVLMNVRRSGTGSSSGVGTVWLEIMGVDANNNPDETVLATSSMLTAASMPFPTADTSFPFTGANQIVLNAGTTYAVVFNASDPPDGTNYVQWMELRQFFNPGQSRHYGVGLNVDNQNYPDQGSLYLVGDLSPGVAWTIPSTTAGVPIVSPDIASVVQQAVNQPGYDPSKPIGIVLLPGSPNGLRSFAAFEHPTFASASLSVTYRTRLNRTVARGAPIQRAELAGAVADRPVLRGAPRSRISVAGSPAERVTLRGAPAERQTLFGESQDA